MSNIALFAAQTWGPKNELIVDVATGKNGNQFLILGVVLAVVWAILFGMFAYYYVSFKKTNAEQKIYGTKMLSSNLVIAILLLVDWILVLVFLESGYNIFAKDPSGAKAAYTAIIALVVIGFVLLVTTIIMMFFFLPYYGIAFDKTRILFMGESIPYAKITKIIKDTKSGDVYVNYSVGKRTHKKQKFSSASIFGQFILENASLTGHKVSEENELDYFKSLLTSDKEAEKRNDAEIAKKVASKNKKEEK